MARSVCRAARAALRGRELRGAKVQVVWHGAGGGGALGRGLEGRRGRGLGGFMRWLSAGCAQNTGGTVLSFAVPARSGLIEVMI